MIHGFIRVNGLTKEKEYYFVAVFLKVFLVGIFNIFLLFQHRVLKQKHW